jgi:plasmid stability protein
MTVIVRLSDEQAEALEARAAAEGLSVEQWLQKLAESGPKPAKETRTGADLIAALQDSPYRDIEIEPERYRLPVRGVTL